VIDPDATLALVESEVGAGRAREAIERILARPEFRPEPRSLLERGRDAVVERLGQLLDGLTGTGAGVVVAWLVVAVLVGLAVVVALRFSRGMRPDPVLDPAPPVQGAGRTAAGWRAEAAESEAAGAWRVALRCRWRALVAELADRGLVEEIPGRTAGEYRRQLRHSAPAATLAFDEATTIFEDAWYGDRPAGRKDAARLGALSAQVLASPGAGAS